MPYEFRKVYLDLITSCGEVCVLYLSWVRFRERWHGQASLEVYDACGARTIVHALGIPPMMDFEHGLEHLPRALEVPGGELKVEVKAVHDGWKPAVPSPCPELQWSIGALRTRARIEWPGPKGPRSASGEGYVDFVRITAATRKLGLRSLHWGRAHMFERSLAFTALDLENDKRWYVGVTRMHGRPARSYGNLAVEIDHGEGTGMVRFGTGGQQLRLGSPRLMHAGSAFDPQRVPKFLHRQVCQLVGGPHEERRWLAKARVDRSHGEGLALHEIVWFGKHARKAPKSRPNS